MIKVKGVEGVGDFFVGGGGGGKETNLPFFS